VGLPARHQLESAFVLHQRPYRDSSLIVDLFTENHGRISVVARGVRKAKSRLAPLLQPFQPLLISWFARGELGTLTAAESNGPPFILNPRVLISGFYINELLVRLVHRDDPHMDLFQAYLNVLQKLSTLPASQFLLDEQIALRGFEVDLLNELGYALILDHEIKDGMPLMPDTLYHYFLEQGPQFIDEHQVRKVIGHHISSTGNDVVKIHGKSLLDLALGTFRDASSLRESKRLMRAALAVHLGSKPLHSRSLLNRLRDPSFKS